MSLSLSSSSHSEESSDAALASRAVQTVGKTATALAKVTKSLDDSAKATAKRLQALKEKAAAEAASAAAEAASAENGQALEADSFHEPQDEPRFEWTFISRIALYPAQTQAEPYTSHEDVDSEKPISCPPEHTVTDKQIDDALQAANPDKLNRLAATPESITFSFSLRVVQRAKALVNVADGDGDGIEYRGARGRFAYIEGVAAGENLCSAGYVVIEQHLPPTSGD